MQEPEQIHNVKIDELVALYKLQPGLQDFASRLKASDKGNFQIKGPVGSQEVFVLAALYRLVERNFVVVLNDKEEALYFLNDLQLLMPRKELLLFPASYKRPYQIEEVDNANVLQRAEVLNTLNHTRTGRQLVVTYAEALYEKVINKRSLVKHTLDVKTGEKCGLEFVVDVLDEYGFERSDFVYEPGQFAVRGGIIDIYSFAHELPYRIDFMDDEVESIRTFDPVSQLTQAKVGHISIIPNIQKNLLTEEKVSFLDYISDRSIVFTRSIPFIQADLDRLYNKAIAYYKDLQKNSGGAALSNNPDVLFSSGSAFTDELKIMVAVEMAKSPYFSPESILEWKGTPQPSFQKEFEMLLQHFKEMEGQGFRNYVFSESEKQLLRLREIFTQLDEEAHTFHFTGVLGEIHEGFTDPQLRITCYTDHQIFDRYHRYKSNSQAARSQALTLKELQELNPGDYVSHVHHGIGKFAGLHSIQVGEHIQDVVKIMYEGGDAIFVNVNALHKVSRYSGKDGAEVKLSKLGSGSWARAKAKTKTRVKELAFDLVSLYARRKLQTGFAFSGDNYMQQELEASFMYEDTPDQVKTTEEVKKDMESPHPMDRLICGDVGFGKTEIAIRAAFKAVLDGKQVAVLVPTTILAVQHFKTFSNRLKDMPVVIDYVNRFRSNNEIKQTLERTAKGEVDILIGTHRIVSDDVHFKDLGLVIVDEEQRFGVNVKDKLKTLRSFIDTLSLTATPIPRTLQFSLAGIRDLSVITTPPPNRQPIDTLVVGFEAERIRDAITYELKRGGQVFFIHPRVNDIEEVASSIKKLVPDARIGIGHGQMPGAKLEQVMNDFIEGQYDILVATTIIESGLDIPNANTILINQANKYGLSELHQMRGRVGRSNRKAFCYLITPPEIVLTSDARKRLKAMEEFSDLGSGFHIALRDLDIRGAGDLLGAEQSGFIAEIGYDMYHKILDEVVRELKEEHFADLFDEEIKAGKTIVADDCQLDLDLDIRIPEPYLPSVSERLKFYRKIAGAEKEDDLRQIQREMLDRFGPLPEAVLNLFDATRIRELGRRIGSERIALKTGVLRIYLIADREAPFYDSALFARMIEYVQLYSSRVKIKESPKYLSLSYEGVSDIKRVLFLTKELHDFVTEQKAAPSPQPQPTTWEG